MSDAFWRNTPLADLSAEQWESLCDGCARCCLHKLQDEDTGSVHYTSVVCRYLDRNCRCSRYEERSRLVGMCVVLTVEDAANCGWLPDSCAYRRLAQGQDLPDWHPLVSGDPQSVHRAGISVKGKCVSEVNVHPASIMEYRIKWVDHQAK